jgi:hypothetical protein
MLLRIIMIAVILARVQRSAGQAGVKGAKNTIMQKLGFDAQKTLNNNYVKLLVVMYLY